MDILKKIGYGKYNKKIHSKPIMVNKKETFIIDPFESEHTMVI